MAKLFLVQYHTRYDLNNLKEQLTTLLFKALKKYNEKLISFFYKFINFDLTNTLKLLKDDPVLRK